MKDSDKKPDTKVQTIRRTNRIETKSSHLAHIPGLGCCEAASAQLAAEVPLKIAEKIATHTTKPESALPASKQESPFMFEFLHQSHYDNIVCLFRFLAEVITFRLFLVT